MPMTADRRLILAAPPGLGLRAAHARGHQRPAPGCGWRSRDRAASTGPHAAAPTGPRRRPSRRRCWARPATLALVRGTHRVAATLMLVVVLAVAALALAQAAAPLGRGPARAGAAGAGAGLVGAGHRDPGLARGGRAAGQPAGRAADAGPELAPGHAAGGLARIRARRWRAGRCSAPRLWVAQAALGALSGSGQLERRAGGAHGAGAAGRQLLRLGVGWAARPAGPARRSVRACCR